MTTAYAANVQYGPGAQVTSGGKTYQNGADHTVENKVPPAAPWVEVGVSTTLQVAFVANAVADTALTSSAPAALTSSAPAALTSVQESTSNAAVQSGSYVQADAQTIAALANSLKTKYNAAQVDIAALRGTLAAVQTDLATVRTERAAAETDLATLRTAHNALVSVVNTLLADLQASGLQAGS